MVRTIGRQASLYRAESSAAPLAEAKVSRNLCIPLTLLRCQPCTKTRTISWWTRKQAHQSIHQAQMSEVPATHSSWSFERDDHRVQPKGRPIILGDFRRECPSHSDCFAVDWKDGKLRTETAAILMLNLHMPADQAAVIRLSSHPSLVYVLRAPPCGTSSRAREVPLRHCRDPAPLHSEAHPAGLPGLSARDQHRVDTANSFTTSLPRCGGTRSGSAYPATWARFQHCCCAGQRPKWTGWLHSPPDTLKNFVCDMLG